MTEVDFTKNWWLSCLANPEKLKLWLQKLQRTELGGYLDHHNFLADHEADPKIRQTLFNIADDELKHSGLLVDMFQERQIAVVPNGVQSTYWEEILENTNDVKLYCAANYFGEALAAFRFQVIVGMDETPSDIRGVINKLLPDEVFHREALQRLAGPDALSVMKGIHDSALAKLLGRS